MARDDWHEDATLLDAWRGGDGNAGASLFDRHSEAVARFFENKIREGTDDLIQQTFLRLIEGRDRIREGVAFRAYVLGVARNILSKHLRKLARGRVVDPEVETMAELAPGPTTVAGRRQEHRLLLEGLRRLPIEHQIALELFYWEELNAAQIAEIVGVSHSAMRSRLVKARQLLEQAIGELAETPAVLASTLGGLDDWAAALRARTDSTHTSKPGAGS
ncbi:MAG: sigma-70 family RNA polymerase sigma factor [Myxococcales bacterium]|nr:sigma-70 family RNA polymerase sigma factor [Myxococcales bacterium]